jgi:hypothetical protein
MILAMAMEEREVEERLLAHYGIRVDRQTSAYVARQLRQAGRALRELPVIGGVARNGAPIRMMIDPATLATPAARAAS